MKTYLNENLFNDFMAPYNAMKKHFPQRNAGLTEEDKALTQQLLAELDEIEALQAAKETAEEVEVLLDTVCYNEKPAGKTIAAITNRLPKHPQSTTLIDLAQAAASGRSWKASVLTGTTNDSFVSSSLVALDIDNKNSYTSINDFLVVNSKYKPCFIYETFSSTNYHQRYRVVFAFDKVITNYDEMVALYEEVKAQYPTVEFDESVDPAKILFGGKTLNHFEDVINRTPSIKIADAAPKTIAKSAHPAHITDVIEDKIEIDEMTVMMNLENIAEQFIDVHEIDINESYEWINKNVKMTDVLGIEENTRFRCILPDHEDNNPSARIATCGDEQVYFCSCEASGYRLITLLSKLLDMSENKTRKFILENLNITYGSEYQRATKIYVADLLFSVDKVMNQELKDYLHRRKLYQTYKLIIEFVYEHVTYESLANDDKIAFFMSKGRLQDFMKQRHISGDAPRKLTALCELGLLKKLTDSEIRSDALTNANKEREALQQKLDKESLNRIDFYELVDLSPSTMNKAMDIVKAMKDNAVRQRRNNINRRINVFGADEVTQGINVQTSINTKKHNKTKAKLQSTINTILESNKYFSEDDLKEAYYATDKKHLTKAKAQQTVIDFIPAFIANGTVKRIRVNKETRKQYNIAAKYKSNTYVYVA